MALPLTEALCIPACANECSKLNSEEESQVPQLLPMKVKLTGEVMLGAVNLKEAHMATLEFSQLAADAQKPRKIQLLKQLSDVSEVSSPRVDRQKAGDSDAVITCGIPPTPPPPSMPLLPASLDASQSTEPPPSRPPLSSVSLFPVSLDAAIPAVPPPSMPPVLSESLQATVSASLLEPYLPSVQLSPSSMPPPPPLMPPPMINLQNMALQSMPPSMPPTLTPAVAICQPSCNPPSVPPPPISPPSLPPSLPESTPPRQPPSLPADLLTSSFFHGALEAQFAALSQSPARFETPKKPGKPDCENASHGEVPDQSSLHEFPPGLPLPRGIPNYGSMAHKNGDCSPCAWFWKPRGCQNGEGCGHCHLCPEGEIKARKKAKKAMMRVGLATPKEEHDSELQNFGAFSCDSGQDKHAGSPCAISDLESTHCSDSEQGSTPSTEQDLVFFSEQDKHSDTIVPISSVSETSMLNTPPGLDLPSFEIPHLGSALHGSGACNPCAWFWKPSGCQSNLNCRFCHLCPEGELKARKKVKRNLMRLDLASPEAGFQSP